MAVADTPPTHRDLLNGVVILRKNLQDVSQNLVFFFKNSQSTYASGDGLVSLRDRHEMTQHGLGLHEPDADVGGGDPVLQDVVREETLGRGSTLEQRHEHLAVLDGEHLAELRAADDLKTTKVIKIRPPWGQIGRLTWSS